MLPAAWVRGCSGAPALAFSKVQTPSMGFLRDPVHHDRRRNARHLDERLFVENHSTSRAATALPNAPLC